MVFWMRAFVLVRRCPGCLLPRICRSRYQVLPSWSRPLERLTVRVVPDLYCFFLKRLGFQVEMLERSAIAPAERTTRAGDWRMRATLKIVFAEGVRAPLRHVYACFDAQRPNPLLYIQRSN